MTNTTDWISANMFPTLPGDEEKYTDIGTNWNSAMQALNEETPVIGIPSISTTLYIPGSGLGLKIETPSMKMPLEINVPLIGDVDIWDFIFSVWLTKMLPWWHLWVIPIPVGLVGYAILRNDEIPLYGKSPGFSPTQTNARFSGLSSGCTWKDVIFDAFLLWMIAKLAKFLGKAAVQIVSLLIGWYVRLTRVKISDVLDRIIQAGASISLDESEVTIRELVERLRGSPRYF